MATESRSAADAFVENFLRWLANLQVVAGARQMRFIDYLELPATARQGDERPIVDQRFTREVLQLIGYHATRSFMMLPAAILQLSRPTVVRSWTASLSRTRTQRLKTSRITCHS